MQPSHHGSSLVLSLLAGRVSCSHVSQFSDIIVLRIYSQVILPHVQSFSPPPSEEEWGIQGHHLRPPENICIYVFVYFYHLVPKEFR